MYTLQVKCQTCPTLTVSWWGLRLASCLSIRNFFSGKPDLAYIYSFSSGQFAIYGGGGSYKSWHGVVMWKHGVAMWYHGVVARCGSMVWLCGSVVQLCGPCPSHSQRNWAVLICLRCEQTILAQPRVTPAGGVPRRGSQVQKTKKKSFAVILIVWLDRR